MDSKLPQVTYIFGAGASAQALPTIKGLPARIKFVAEYLDSSYKFDPEDKIIVTKDVIVFKQVAKEFLLEGLNRLYENSIGHSTIDTYAKKLYINGNNRDVEELVFFLSLYFNLEQKLSGFDSRYETFLISILSSSTYSFPRNVKFLTWNYDLQMELAYRNLSRTSDSSLDFDRFSNNQRIEQSIKEEFNSVKINGSCCMSGRMQSMHPLIKSLGNEDSSDDLDFALCYGYLHLKERRRIYESQININFAWYQQNQFLNVITKLYDQTEILVVIGYSFPFFNRDVDRKLIQGMTSLKKIYIQDLDPESIKSRFLSILPDWENIGIQIISVTDISEFFLPPEL